MWAFSENGMYSVVAARCQAADGSFTGDVDPQTLLVRARIREHLERLCDAHAASGLSSEIITTPTHDYRFRLVIAKPTWSSVMTEMVEAIDYTNFKRRALQLHGSGPYTDALSDIWTRHHRMQAVNR